MNFHTDIVNFFFLGGALISKILLVGGALFREGRLSESGRSFDHLRYTENSHYSLSTGFWQSFVTIRSCNCLVKIVSTYVGNFKEK